MTDYAAHRLILAWAYASHRITGAEYGSLMHGVNLSEWEAMACTGKTPFRDFLFAHKIAQKSAGRHDCGMKVYKCHQCGLWHIGQKTPPSAIAYKPQVFKRAADER